MTESNLCQWCGRPATAGLQLCESCQWAKSQSTQLERSNTEKKPVDAAFILVQIGKALLAGILSLIALTAALAGTCSLIGTIFGGIAVLPFAVIAFGVLALMIWLIFMMYKSDLKQTIKHQAPPIMPPKGPVPESIMQPPPQQPPQIEKQPEPPADLPEKNEPDTET